MAILLYIIVSAGLLSAEDFFPYEGATLDYIHVLFDWPQFSSGGIEYSFYISNLTTGEDWFSSHEINTFLLEEYLEWGMDYRWQICYSSDYDTECLEPIFFSINDLPSNHPDSVQIDKYDEDQYIPGLNMVVVYNTRNSFITDQFGNTIAYVNKTNLGEPNFYASQFLDNGNIIGHSVIPLSGIGYELDLNGEIYFQTQSDGHHHDFIKSSRGTYFGIKNTFDYIENICEDTDPLYVYWEGDAFYEYDSNGNLIWEWGAKDHLNITEFNPDFCDGIDPNVIDWTHANSVFYDEKTNSVLVSLRNISRIINIDYDTGDINWQIGETQFMDTVNYIIDFEFSGQHAAEILENGNILFYDNHSWLMPQVSGCTEFSYDSTLSEFYKVWNYELDESLFGQFAGDCDRLKNGHTLIITGSSGHLIELNENDEIVWDISFYNNLQLMRLVRGQRILNLYPVAFNIFIENYHDSNTELVDNAIQIKITNMGWSENIFIVELKHDQESISIDSVYVNQNHTTDWSIQAGDVLDGNLEYKLSVYPVNAQNKEKKFNISLDDSLPDAIIPTDDIYIQSVFPNPFNTSVKIKFSIPESGDVLLNIYNIVGQQIGQLSLVDVAMGNYSFYWNAYDQTSGVYMLKIVSGKYSQMQKVTLVK